MSHDVDPEHAQRVVDAYLAAISAGDVDAVMALYAPEATVEDPVGSDVVVGAPDVRVFYERACAIPMKASASGAARISGPEVAFPFVLDVAEGAMTIEVIDAFRFDAAGRIVSMRAWWGPSTTR